MSWPEIENCKDKSRREVAIKDCPRRFEEIGCTPPVELYSLTLVNFLQISGCELTSISNDISVLINLRSLILDRNKLKQLPDSLCELENLKVLDVSSNDLDEVPLDFGKLRSLQTLNLNSNNLVNFPENIDGLELLAVLDLSSNHFTALPGLFMQGKHSHLAELKMSHNLIDDVSDGIGMLEALKSLDLSSNKIKELPQVISKCNKLKSADYADNPLKDRRLKKLIEQKNSSQKAIMDYIKTKGRPPMPSTGGGTENLTGKHKKGGASLDEDTLVKHLMKVLRFNHGALNEDESHSLEVVATDDVRDVRPYIVCCVVKRLNLTTDCLLKKFLVAQTKLHDGACARRTIATIATHDLSSIGDSKLYYDAKEPDLFSITPLGRGEEVTALQLYKRLKIEADDIRKEKKKNQVSGVYKYLALLEKHEKFACLIKPSDGTVISLPPLTNCDGTRMKIGENDILLEVTSAQNLGSCKNIMDKLLQLMVNEGLYSCRERDFYSDSSNDEVSVAELPTLILQQVKITDSNGKLRVMYPSKTDLCFNDPAIKIERFK